MRLCVFTFIMKVSCLYVCYDYDRIETRLQTQDEKKKKHDEFELLGILMNLIIFNILFIPKLKTSRNTYQLPLPYRLPTPINTFWKTSRILIYPPAQLPFYYVTVAISASNAFLFSIMFLFLCLTFWKHFYKKLKMRFIFVVAAV